MQPEGKGRDTGMEPMHSHLLAERVVVVGLGGFGCHMIGFLGEKLQGLVGPNLELVGVDTDACAVQILDERGVRIGIGAARGMAAGGDADLGRRSVEEALPWLSGLFRRCEIAILVAGLGGGTGSGGIPVVAEAAKKAGAYVIAVTTRPSELEGVQRQRIAEIGEMILEKHTDSLVWVETRHWFKAAEKLREVNGTLEQIRPEEVFQKISALVCHALRDLCVAASTDSLTYFDIREMKKVLQGRVLVGTGVTGEDGYGEEAVRQAVEGLRQYGTIASSAKRCLVIIEYRPGINFIRIAQTLYAASSAVGNDQPGGRETMGTEPVKALAGLAIRGQDFAWGSVLAAEFEGSDQCIGCSIFLSR